MVSKHNAGYSVSTKQVLNKSMLEYCGISYFHECDIFLYKNTFSWAYKCVDLVVNLCTVYGTYK